VFSAVFGRDALLRHASKPADWTKRPALEHELVEIASGLLLAAIAFATAY
jgi:hypothetical protein